MKKFLLGTAALALLTACQPAEEATETETPAATSEAPASQETATASETMP